MTVRASQVVKVQIFPFFIGKAAIASFIKSSHMQDTFKRGRSDFEKYLKSFIGDLAKNAVKWWLETNGFEVLDWDDIRRSWRSSRKNYDLEVNNYKIEVKSSIVNTDNLSQALRNNNIIHPTYTKMKDITVQVFFPDTRCIEAWICAWVKKEDFDDPRFISPRRINNRNVPFYLMPFSDEKARPMRELIDYLRQ